MYAIRSYYAVFLHENPCREGFLCVVVVQGDDCLHDDGTGVDAFVQKMHGAPRKSAPVGERLPGAVCPGEGGKERGVDVQDPVREGMDEHWCQDPHEPRKADKLRPGTADDLDKLRVEFLPG